MPYLGRQPSIGRFAHLDDITSSFNSACTTFSLMQSSVALVPGAASNLIISLGGVLQEPEVAYTVAGSSIIFSSAPASTQPFFGILLGDVLDVGQVSQGAVINATSLTVTGAATLSNTLAVTGAATLSNTLAVTGAATLSNTLAVTGATTLSSTVATGALTITGAATYTTSLKSTTALATPGALSATQATAFASTVSGASIMGFGTTNDVALMNRAGTVVLGIGPNTTTVNMTGLLTVSGFGTSSFSAGGTGSNTLIIRNTTAGVANYGELRIPNDTNINVGLALHAYSSTYTTSGPEVASGVHLYGNGVGGLSISANNASGAIRFYSGGLTERARLAANGEYYLGSSMTAVNSGLWTEHFSGAVYYGMTLNETASTSGAGLISFNMAGTQKGSIVFTGTTGVVFNTTSDARLKMDMGVAITVDVLRRTVIHDFDWIADGSRARGVFAQEAYAVAPFAVSVGSDEMKDGHLAKPWSVDYSKFVPDLIVGWQQHDATISQLAARIAALESQGH